MKFDMHCHVKEALVDSKVGLEECIEKLKANGFQGMLITDHDTYKGYRHWKNDLKGKVHQDFVVLKGIEYDTRDAGHILCILPEGVRMRLMELRGLPVSVLIDFVHRHGGILGPAHPYGAKYQSITNTKKYRLHPEIIDRFDFIETFNACESAESNRAAAELASEHGKPGFGGSDAHKIECVSKAYTILPQPVSCETELILMIKQGAVVESGGEYYNGTTKEKLGKVNNVLVYGFWFYNKAGEILSRHKRKLKGALENPVDPIDPIDLKYLHSIKRYKVEA